MEAGGGIPGGSFHAYHSNPFCSPPLTAIDRFLCGQSHFSHQQLQNSSANSNETVVSLGNGFCTSASSLSGGANISHEDYSWPNGLDQEVSLFDGFFLGEDVLKTTQQNMYNNNNNNNNPHDNGLEKDQQVKAAEEISKGVGKRGKKACNSETFLIKGQWTEEEDR